MLIINNAKKCTCTYLYLNRMWETNWNCGLKIFMKKERKWVFAELSRFCRFQAQYFKNKLETNFFKIRQKYHISCKVNLSIRLTAVQLIIWYNKMTLTVSEFHLLQHLLVSLTGSQFKIFKSSTRNLLK